MLAKHRVALRRVMLALLLVGAALLPADLLLEVGLVCKQYASRSYSPPQMP